MKKIITYLYKNSDKEECFYESSSSICLNINGYNIKIHVSTSNNNINEANTDENYDNDFKYKRLEDIDEFIFLNPYSEISEFNIFLIENLSIKKNDLDIYDYNAVSQSFYEPRSFSKELFKVIKELKDNIPTLNLKYSFTKFFDDSCFFCDGEPDYIASILIDHTTLKFEDVLILISILNSAKEEKLESYYLKFWRSKNEIKNTFDPQFVNTNTKVRRLGYLKIFFIMIAEKKKIPATFLNKKYEEYTLNYTDFLKESEYKRGLITTLNGKSAEPYITLLKEFNLIEIINRIALPSKKLKVYLELSKSLNSEKNTNPFLLNEFDKFFFLELILQSDFLYSSIILELIYINKSPDIKYLIESFQNKILERLSDFLSQNIDYRSKSVRKILEIKKRIESWEKAIVYLEHIIMPRVNWFADLGLIHLTSNNKIILQENGTRLIQELFSWIDINSEFVSNSTYFLKNFHPHIASKTYGHIAEKNPTFEFLIENFDKYILESFTIFRTLAPNRITSSQAFTYVKYSFYFNNNICISDIDIERIIQNNFAQKYIYKYQNRYDDGYIQII